MNMRIVDFHHAFERGERTPLEVLEAVFASIEKDGAPEHVFTALTRERAERAARASTERWRSNKPLGPLDGVPIVWKDVFDVAGTVTTCGSRVRAQAAPATADAELVRQLEAQGMVSIGKTTLSEFAYSGLGINPYPGTPRNPVDQVVARIPGGSSSGSAAAVALGWVPCGMGSDTSGSIRVPAAFQALVGFKPSHGRYSTQGMYPLAPSLDTAGPLVREVADACLLDEMLTGQTCEPAGPLSNWRFIVPTGRALAQASPEVQAVFEDVLARLSRAGAGIEHREFAPFELTRRIFEEHGTLVAVEATRVHEALMASSEFLKVDPRIAARMRRGASLAQADRDIIETRRAPLAAMAGKDLAEREVLLYPTVSMTAPAMAPLEEDDEWFAQCNLQVLHNTMLGSYLDMPTLSLPAGPADDGLPVGVSLSAASGRDARLLGLGKAVQELLLR